MALSIIIALCSRVAHSAFDTAVDAAKHALLELELCQELHPENLPLRRLLEDVRKMGLSNAG